MTGSVKAEKAPKKSWFKGLKSEFKKVVWPDKKTLGKQAVAVTVITAVLCVVITILDSLVLQIINFLIK